MRRGAGSVRIGVYFLVFGLVLAVAAGLGVWYAKATAERYALDDSTKDAQFAADGVAKTLDTSFAALREQMTATAEATVVSKAIANPDDCTLSFTGMGPISSGHLDFLAADGARRCSSLAIESGSDYAGTTWLPSASEGYTLVGPTTDTATGKTVVIGIAPVADSSGYVAVFLDLDTLGPGLGKEFAGRRRLEIVVMSSEANRIISRSIDATKWTGATLPPNASIDMTGAGENSDVDGVVRLYATAVVPGLGWKVYAGAPEADALADAQRSFSQARLVVLVALAIILLMLAVVYRRIAGPIRSLSRSVHAQHAHHAGHIEVRGPKEVTVVADEFNSLVQHLQKELVVRQAAESSARESERTYRVLFEHNPQPMWIWERDSMAFLAVNDAAVSHYGYSRDEFLSMRLSDILPPAHALDGSAPNPDGEMLALQNLGDAPLHSSGPWRHITKQGDLIAVDITSHSFSFYGRAARFAMITDVTQRLAHEEQLRHLALHDELTGLPNRTLALDRLTNNLAHAPAGRITVGVLFLDLDRFKQINDVHGHQAGDEMMIELARRLMATFRSGDTVARLSSDEFAIVCPDLSGETEAISMAGRIEGLLASPFTIGESEVFLTASVGISLFAGAGDAEEMMRDAAAAASRAKQRGGNRYEIFDDGIRARTLVKLETSNELRRAIDRDELQLHYQPEIDLRDGSCFGAEALVRWQHPTRGLLAPAHFVPLAEENGFIVQLGNWVLHSACRQAAEWIAAGIGPRSVSVNLSARELAQPTLVGEVGSALDQSGLDPAALCLEITETSLVEDPEGTVGVLASLRDLGVRLSIDDFGTGYSSLLYLRRYHVDLLKIDRSFVGGLGVDAQDTAIVASVIDLAHALGITVIAEGVETQSQADRLTTMRCDLGQGFLWARPISADELPLRIHQIEATLSPTWPI
ncbi:MAG TPA: EAL domain-containing protein [Ilumatobacteraceae bacterium]